jgi:hypothetical protein
VYSAHLSPVAKLSFWRVLIALCSCLALLSCGAATADKGYELSVRVPKGQLVRGSMPAPAGGPEVTFLDIRDASLRPGITETTVQGRVSQGSYALNLSIRGDSGYWIFPVGLPDEVVANELQFRTGVDFARTLKSGPLTMLIQAVDSNGRAGNVREAPFEIEPDLPESVLRFSLQWDAQVDADIVVVTPSGQTIGSKNINSAEPPPLLAPEGSEDLWKLGGRLDFDSNANCTIDGLRSENVFWTSPPPKGRYLVYVALPSTCGLDRTAFRLTIRYNGTDRSFTDVLYASDGRRSPQDGDAPLGLLVTEFDVP